MADLTLTPTPAAAAVLSLDELKFLYREGQYQTLLAECEKALAANPQDHAVQKLYQRAKGKVEQSLSQQEFIKNQKELSAYRKDTALVKSIDEALYWIGQFLVQQEYRKAIRGCYEILMVDPENKRAKEILSQAKAAHDSQETKLKNSLSQEREEQSAETQKKMAALEKLKYQMANLVELEKYDKAEKIVKKILAIDPQDAETLEVQQQLERVKASMAYGDKPVHTVDFSSLKKWKRFSRIYWIKGNKSLAQSIKNMFSHFRETETERLKRKALDLVKEKKDNNALALKIQKSIIPQIDKYTLPGFDVWGDTIQSEKIGGDNFNFIQRDKENILFYIGDASGHGIQASLFASQVNLILRDCVHQEMGLLEMTIELNRRIQETEGESKNFMTMILLNWNLKNKVLSFVGAGHEYIIHFKNEDKKIELLPAKGIAIGMIQDIAPLLSERQIKLADQDGIVLFSDGVIESELKEKENELFGVDRLNDLIMRHQGTKNSREMYTAIMKELGETSIQKDDVTLLVLRRDQSSDLIFAEDLSGIESVNMNTLKNLSRAEVERSIQEISLEQKTKKLLIELDNLMKRGEYQMIVNKCISAIRDDNIYNKQVNVVLKKAKKILIKLRQKERRDMIEVSYQGALERFKVGEYLQTRMELLKILKLDEKNIKIKYLLKRVENKILKEGPRNLRKKKQQETWMNKMMLDINKGLSPPNKKDNLEFIVKLANLVNSGIKVKDSLLILIKQAKKEGLKDMYRKMIDNLEKGFLLSFSMASYPKVFPSLQVNLVRAGEESGNLGPILDDLSKQLMEQRELRRKIKGALIYPAFIISFSILLVVGMLIGVVPKLAEAYADANLVLPLPTRIIIAVSEFLQTSWYVVLIALVIFFVALAAFKKTLMGQEFFDRMSLKLPILKDLAGKENIYLFSNSMSMLVDSGLLLLDAMSISADVVENIYYKRDIIRMRTEIVNGQTLSHALGIDALTDAKKKPNEYFPIEVAQMAQVGETTGQITKMLRMVGNNFQDEIKQFAKNFATIIEPILIVFIGVLVGVLLVAIMLPFFEFGKAIQNL